MEQMLISNAVDRALSQVDLSIVQGQPVYLSKEHLNAVDQGYIVGSLRHQILAAGGRLVDEQADSSITLEVRSGGVGTDNVNRFVGFPGVALPGPLPVELPEVPFWSRITQYGTAKIGVAAYATQGRQMLQCGGQFLARSDESQWTVLGIGPFGGGSVRRELRSSTAADPLRDSLASHRLPSFYRSAAEPYADPLQVAMAPAARPPLAATAAPQTPTMVAPSGGVTAPTDGATSAGGETLPPSHLVASSRMAALTTADPVAAATSYPVAPAAALKVGPDQNVRTPVGATGGVRPGLTGAASWPQE